MLWVLFFVGGLAIPMQTGIMLSLVEPEYRPQATAIANTMYNAIGYFPAPFIYGIIQQWTTEKGEDSSRSKWGMIFTLVILFPAFIFQAFALILKPDMKEYLEERKKKFLKEFGELIEKDDGQEPLLNDLVASVEEHYDSLHPGYQ